MNERMKTGPAAILLAIGAYFGFVVAVAQFHGMTAFALGLPSGLIASLAAGCGVAGAIWFLFAFLGILALRKFVEDPARRAIWSAVATIIAYVDVPIVYFSVRWWNSLHQQQSNPGTVSKQFWLPLRLNAFGILFLMIAFIMLRARIASLRLKQEMAPPLPEMSELGEAV